MKDLKIIELLTDVIYYPFKNDLINLKTLHKDEPDQLRVIFLLLWLIYRFFNYVIDLSNILLENIDQMKSMHLSG